MMQKNPRDLRSLEEAHRGKYGFLESRIQTERGLLYNRCKCKILGHPGIPEIRNVKKYTSSAERKRERERVKEREQNR